MEAVAIEEVVKLASEKRGWDEGGRLSGGDRQEQS